MSEGAARGPGLPAEPGLCAACRYASVKDTRRGTTYLRCTRASWDSRLARYPRLPVASCAGFAPAAGARGSADAGRDRRAP